MTVAFCVCDLKYDECYYIKYENGQRGEKIPYVVHGNEIISLDLENIFPDKSIVRVYRNNSWSCGIFIVGRPHNDIKYEYFTPLDPEYEDAKKKVKE